MIACGAVVLVCAGLTWLAYRWLDARSEFYDGRIIGYHDAKPIGRGFRKSFKPIVVFTHPTSDRVEFVNDVRVDRPFEADHAVRVRVFRGRPCIHDLDRRFFGLVGQMVVAAAFFGVAVLQHFDPGVIERWQNVQYRQRNAFDLQPASPNR